MATNANSKLIVRKGLRIGLSRRVVKPSDGRPLLELLQWPLYSKKTFTASTSQTQTFFKGISGATLLDTNMSTDSLLPSPQSLDILGITIVTEFGMVEADLINFMNNGFFEFRISNKPYVQIPVQKIPMGCGLSGFASTTENNTRIFEAGNGVPSPFVYYPVDIEGMSIYLPSQQDFQVSIQTFNSVAFTDTFDVWVYLHGILARPVM